MTNGLEKFDWLFSGSRRKDRARSKAKQQQQQQTIPASIVRRPSSPMFPSPSYLRPTSMQMTPRDPQIDRPESDKGRSHSVPTLKQALSKRSSGASSVTVVAPRPSRPEAPTSSLRYEKKSPHTSQLARFRFPEDSLFKNDSLVRAAGKPKGQHSSRDPSPRARVSEPSSEKGLLDWSPKPMSFLFNPMDFQAYPNGPMRSSMSDGTESTLLPSPDFAPGTLMSTKSESLGGPNQPPCAPLPLSQCDPVQRLTLSLRQQSLLPHSRAIIGSPPILNSGQYTSKPGIHRSSSLDDISAPRPDTPMLPPSTFKRRRNVRETWGKRLEDPRFGYPSEELSEGVTHSRPLRKSASTSTLSLLEYQLTTDNVLLEPTFDDFYALSDDDIAESLPLAVAYDDRAPPTPPPKDISRASKKFGQAQPLATQSTLPKPPPGEITPPCTPTKPHLLALPCSPITPLDTFGALLAADLASKYDFAVLYVLSLWPVGCREDDFQHDTPSPPPPGPMPPRTTAAMTGRLLAAYGLNEVPSPFEISTETHLAALNCDHWNEYRNIDARPGEIWRGWVRTFNQDQALKSVTTTTSTLPMDDCPKDRGIVFAAYSKKGSRSGMLMRTTPEKELLLHQLYLDAKALVEVLLQHPSKRRKDAKFFADFPTPDHDTRSTAAPS